jgi:hypothetical protein
MLLTVVVVAVKTGSTFEAATHYRCLNQPRRQPGAFRCGWRRTKIPPAGQRSGRATVELDVDAEKK